MKNSRTIQRPAVTLLRTLRRELEGSRLGAARAIEIGLALTEALDHLHGHSLVHRDVKPSNIIFVNGRPKLADIGLVTECTDRQSIVGTEGYLPLEGPGTPAADIYALGKVFGMKHLPAWARRFPELPADIRQWEDAREAFELNAVVVKACASDCSKRYSSAKQMHSDLEALQAGRSVRDCIPTRAMRYAIRFGLAAGVLMIAPQFCSHWRLNRASCRHYLFKK